LARVHGMSIGNIGMWMGIVVGFGGIIGTFAGGYLADKYGSKNIRMYLLIPVIAGIASIPFSITQIFHGNATFVLVMHFFTALLTALYLGPSIAVTHNLVNAKMRALASAVLFFFLNLIGLGLGPLTIGYLSDVLTPTYGNESLRYAFCFTFIPSILSMFLFYMASKHYEDDIDQTVKGASDTDVF
jgi:MFS family permease